MWSDFEAALADTASSGLHIRPPAPYSGGRVVFVLGLLGAQHSPDRLRAAGKQALAGALACLGLSESDVTRRSDGGFQCSPGVAVSVSHSGAAALAVAWQRNPGGTNRLGIGVDLEYEEIPPSAWHLVARPEERSVLAAQPSWLNPTRVFSAKEAIYKTASRAHSERFVPRRISLFPINPRSAVSSAGVITSLKLNQYWMSICTRQA